MISCETCNDTGRVKTVFDEGLCYAPEYDQDAPHEACPHCAPCPHCGDRIANGDFVRPFPEHEACCAGCAQIIRDEEEGRERERGTA